MSDKLLEIKNLDVSFVIDGQFVNVVNKLNIHLGKGETVGLVGESGCGKSVTSLAAMGLIKSPPGHVKAEAIEFEGADLLKLSEKQMVEARGNRISMIFQDPLTALNPVFSIGYQIAEVLITHKGLKKKQAMEEAIRLMESVGIPDAKRRSTEYPHQLSGGLRQRIMIAMAIACSPSLLIADEPTTALDVTIQAQVLDLLKKKQQENGMAILLITHDLGVISKMADRVYVMYAGEVVECSPVSDLFRHPLHPYTQGLIKAMPENKKRNDELYQIPGNVPNPANRPDGCLFHPRCPFAKDNCRSHPAELTEIDNRWVRCHKYRGETK